MDHIVLPKRELGRTGLQVSGLGLSGAWGISADDVERAFHELGVNYFFVLPRYKGLLDGVRRLVRAGHRDEIVVAGGANIPTGFTIPGAWEKCARSVGVEQVDVFHLFYVQTRWYVTGGTWPAMRRLKEQGKVKALAISGHDRPLVVQLAKELYLDVVMVRYNAAHRGAEGEIFAQLGEARPGVVTYTATRWKRLLQPLGEHPAMTAPECYRFCLGHEAVDVALCGAASFEELRDDVQGVLEGPLDPDRLEAAQRLGDAVRASATGRLGFWRA